MILNSHFSSKSSTSPPRQMQKVLPDVGFSLVVWPVIAPSSTLQNLGLPSQPSRLLPSKIDLKPASSSAAKAEDEERPRIRAAASATWKTSRRRRGRMQVGILRVSGGLEGIDS